MTLFSSSVLFLLLFIYFETSKEMDSHIKQTINSHISELSVTFYQDGLEETIALIQDMIQHDTDNNSFYMLMDKDFTTITGHLEIWPYPFEIQKSWHYFHIPTKIVDSDDILADAHFIGRMIDFKGGYILVVGFNLRHMKGIQDIIRNVLFGTLGVTFIVALLSGLIITRIISTKLAIVNQACWRVMQGNMDEKIPVMGGGDAFEDLAEHFNAMLGWISALIKGIENVSHSIAHDLRSPLSRVRQKLENIVIHHSETQGDALPAIRESIKEIDNLIQTFNAILRISEVQSKAGIESFERFDVSETLYNVVDFYQPLMEEKHISYTASINPALQMHGDKHLITQTIANLLDNAIKYSPHDSHISLSLYIQEGLLYCDITDQGPGIAPEFHEKVKERFFRLDASRTTKGNGLGLSLVDAVIKLHNGTMLFHDNHPGLKVSLTFPRGNVE